MGTNLTKTSLTEIHSILISQLFDKFKEGVPSSYFDSDGEEITITTSANLDHYYMQIFSKLLDKLSDMEFFKSLNN